MSALQIFKSTLECSSPPVSRLPGPSGNRPFVAAVPKPKPPSLRRAAGRRTARSAAAPAFSPSALHLSPVTQEFRPSWKQPARPAPAALQMSRTHAAPPANCIFNFDDFSDLSGSEEEFDFRSRNLELKKNSSMDAVRSKKVIDWADLSEEETATQVSTASITSRTEDLDSEQTLSNAGDASTDAADADETASSAGSAKEEPPLGTRSQEVSEVEIGALSRENVLDVSEDSWAAQNRLRSTGSGLHTSKRSSPPRCYSLSDEMCHRFQ